MGLIYNLYLKKLAQNVQKYKEYGDIYFPAKTNHNKHIINCLKDLTGFEIDSIDHLNKVLTAENASKIIYSNVAKSEEDIIYALKKV